MAVVQKQNNMPNKTKPTVKQQIKGNKKLKKAYKKSSKKQLARIKQNLSNLSTEELMKLRKESPAKLPIAAVIAKVAKVGAKVGKIAAKGAKVVAKGAKVAGKAVAKGAKAVGKGAKVAGKAVGKGVTKGAKFAKSEKGRKIIGGVKEGIGAINRGGSQRQEFSNPGANFKQMNFSGEVSPFAMKGFTGFGNSPVKAKTDAAKNLLKAVPNKKAYDKLSDIEKKGFDKAAKKAGLPTKKSPAKAGQTAGQIIRRERLMT